MAEIWKHIKGFEGLYEVSNLGRVKSLERFHAKERILKPMLTVWGYARVQLYKNRSSKKFTIHRLVAEAFIPNLEQKPHINHIDENRLNNTVENLAWCTAKENNNHGTHIQKLVQANKNHPAKSKTVACYAKNGFFVRTYPSIREAERQTGIFNQSIVQCCQGKRKTAGGYVWKEG